MTDPRHLYLDLMKRCLLNLIYTDAEFEDAQPTGALAKLATKAVRPVIESKRVRLVRPKPFDRYEREQGLDWPPFAHSMSGLQRMNNVQRCVEQVIADGIPGDLIETGVWRGGMTIFMRAILQAYGVTRRRVWVADSFAGLPRPDPEKYPADARDQHFLFSELAVPFEKVQRNFEVYGLLDDQVQFLKGWFKDTLPTAPIEQLSVLRLDGDMYESTMDAIVCLYPKLAVGGYCIVDDYGYSESCKRATHDYRERHGITEPIQPVDWTGVYWRKEK